MRGSAVLLMVISSLLFGGAALSQEVEYVSSTLFSGSMNSITVDGDFAYCGTFKYLQIFSIADPANPVQVGGYAMPENYDSDMKIAGNYAYMVWFIYGPSGGMFEILNIEDRSHPILAGSYDDLCEPREIIVSGEYAFIADTVLQIIDISEPSEPVLAGSYSAGTPLYHVCVSEGYAYVPHDQVVDILDISNPSEPVSVYTVELPNYASDVLVTADLGYFSWSYGPGPFGEGENGFLIMDVSDPETPSLVGSYCCGNGAAQQISVGGGYAYIRHLGSIDESPFGGIEVVDVSDAEDPVYVTYCEDLPLPADIYASGVDIFAVGHGEYDNDFLEIIDFSDPFNPVTIGNFGSPWVMAASVIDDIAYVGCSYPGLVTLDISDPYAPELIGQLEMSPAGGAWWHDIYCRDSHAFVAKTLHLWIVDVSVPSGPVLLGQLETPSNAQNVFVAGDYAYVGCYPYFQNKSVFIVDISDPSDPAPCCNYLISEYPQDVYVVNDHAFVANSDDGLLILDVSDPYEPSACGSYDTEHHATGVFVRGDYAYLSAGQSGLLILDITDPCDPELTGTCAIPGTADGVIVSGDYAYVNDRQPPGGIYVIDVSQPSSPFIAADYETPGSAPQLFVDGEYIYVADLYAFIILRFDPQTGIEEIVTVPIQFSIAQNYPNPFNASTTIRYDLPEQSDVMIAIYDLLGREIETLMAGWQPAGSHSVVWDAKDASSGVYFYRIEAGDYTQTRKCVLLR